MHETFLYMSGHARSKQLQDMDEESSQENGEEGEEEEMEEEDQIVEPPKAEDSRSNNGSVSRVDGTETDKIVDQASEVRLETSKAKESEPMTETVPKKGDEGGVSEVPKPLAEKNTPPPQELGKENAQVKCV